MTVNFYRIVGNPLKSDNPYGPQRLTLFDIDENVVPYINFIWEKNPDIPIVVPAIDSYDDRTYKAGMGHINKWVIEHVDDEESVNVFYSEDIMFIMFTTLATFVAFKLCYENNDSFKWTTEDELFNYKYFNS